MRALSGRMDCRGASGESGCSPAVLCPEALSFSSVVGGLLWSWSNDAAPIWCLLAQSHRLSTPSQTHTHTHATSPVIPQTSTPVIDSFATCANTGAKNMCECVCCWRRPPVLSSPSHGVAPTDMCSGWWESKCFVFFSGVISSCPANDPESQP